MRLQYPHFLALGATVFAVVLIIMGTAPHSKIVLTYSGSRSDLQWLISPNTDLFYRSMFDKNLYAAFMKIAENNIAELILCKDPTQYFCCINLLSELGPGVDSAAFPRIDINTLCFDLSKPVCDCRIAYYLKTAPDADINYLREHIILPSRRDVARLPSPVRGAMYYALARMDVNACPLVPGDIGGPACVVLHDAAAKAYFCGASHIPVNYITASTEADSRVCIPLLRYYFGYGEGNA